MLSVALETKPWIGLDRTGDPDEPYKSSSVVATAKLSPSIPGVTNVVWSYKSVCDGRKEEPWRTELWTTSRANASSTNLNEKIRATVLGATAVTNFTVVKVDVMIGDVDEKNEETEEE